MRRLLAGIRRTYLCRFANRHVFRWYTGRGFYCQHCLTRAPERL